MRVLTGTSLEFVTDDRASPNSARCFWGATTPEPQYVEIEVFSRPTGLSGYTFNPEGSCATVAVTGVGAEAQGGTCSDPQHKVFLIAWDRGIAVRVLVNEPTGALQPQDLADAVNGVINGLH